MSPASKNKKAVKTSSHANSTGDTPASGYEYDPVSGTFQTFDTTPISSAGHDRFRNIDYTDDDSGNLGVEYDSVSNAESWSGGSEDHGEKPPQSPAVPESVPGADNDKREKIRQRNERKHQRQKERRAQELNERCSGYLMSWKLEALAKQLVAMGFSQERARVALVMNKGRVEESVAWLCDAGEEEKQAECNDDGVGNLKIDISEELAQITNMMVKYNGTKQEVQRAVVSCEGDLEKADEILKARAGQKHVETGDPPTLTTNGNAPLATKNNLRSLHAKPTPTIIQQKRDDIYYTKTQANVGSSVETSSKSVQLLKKVQPPPNTERPKPQEIPTLVEKIWPPNGGSSKSVSFSPATPLQVSPLSSSEMRNSELRSVKEPFAVLQRPQPVNVSKQAPTPSLGSYTSAIEPLNNGFIQPPPATSRSLSPDTVSSSNPMYDQIPYQSQLQFTQPRTSNSMNLQGTMQVKNNGGVLSQGSASAPLIPTSTLGLFSGMHTTNGLNASKVDWNTGSSMQFDYTDIDWSLDRGLLASKSSGLWHSSSYNASQNKDHSYDSFGYVGSVKSNVLRPMVTDGCAGSFHGLQDGFVASGDQGGSGSSREWTSPFEEKDLFCIPRQIVYSPL